MLTVTKPAPNRIDVELAGSVDAEAMREGLDALLDLSRDVVHGGMLYRIPGFALPTPAAVAVEMGRLPQLFGLLGRFDRCAVVSDVAWLRTAAVVEGALLPGIEVKGFPLDAAAQAEAWLEESDPGGD